MPSITSSLAFIFGCQMLVLKNFHVCSFSVNSSTFPPIPSSSSLLPTFSERNVLTKIYSQQNEEIEAYVGPMRSLSEMEGGITVAENALNVFTGPSLVAPGRGLFLSIYNEYRGKDNESIDDSREESIVEEVVIPQGTPLCGYSRGYFSSEETGDKSVSFMFSADALVFFEKQLMGIGDAIATVHKNDRLRRGPNELLWGHIVEFDEASGSLSIDPDEEFHTRIFIPDREDNEHEFAVTCLGIYANDLAYDPDHDEEKYFETSERNNILQLIWRLAKDEKTGILMPTWPVVIARKDFRLVNTVPMEVGLQYGFRYWDSFQHKK